MNSRSVCDEDPYTLPQNPRSEVTHWMRGVEAKSAYSLWARRKMLITSKLRLGLILSRPIDKSSFFFYRLFIKTTEGKGCWRYKLIVTTMLKGDDTAIKPPRQSPSQFHVWINQSAGQGTTVKRCSADRTISVADTSVCLFTYPRFLSLASTLFLQTLALSREMVYATDWNYDDLSATCFPV